MYVYFIGDFLLKADKEFKEISGSSASVPSRGRPSSKSLFEVLDQNDQLVVSGTTLRETTYVAMTVSKFPLLSYVNEPLSHFATAGVKTTAQLIADIIQESMRVPTSMSTAYSTLSPYKLDASSVQYQDLSDPVPSTSLVPNDGDGIVILQTQNSLNGSHHHRLFAIDAPELFSTSFINANMTVYKQRNGHLSHLALHFYLNRFTEPQGTGDVHIEYPENRDMPTDRYGRWLSSFWFVWSSCPNNDELTVIDAIIQVLQNEEADVKKRIVNMTNPRAAMIHQPFLLNLNALLVLSGFSVVFTK